MLSILIVEDDPHISEMIARLLSSKGYRTRVETNGAAGLLAAHADLPDLMITDLMMPILQGQDAIQALRKDKRTAHIPIVVLSARDDDQTLAQALMAGANLYLLKPVDPHALLSVVERLTSLTPAETEPTPG